LRSINSNESVQASGLLIPINMRCRLCEIISPTWAQHATSLTGETKMLLQLPIIILASLPFVQVADGVPKFDIAKECRAEGGPQAVLDRCAADEATARDQLQPLWTQFNPHGTPSYVELKICLEMARDAKKAAK
jgi:hypothetical protein